MMHYEARAAAPGAPKSKWDPAVAVPTLLGSLLSSLATLTVIFLWISFGGGGKRRQFRYVLILNLTIAEFMNSTNNTASGFTVVKNRGYIAEGVACDYNGWLNQFSVQAVDFSILAISVVTMLTIQLRSAIIYASTATKALICVSIWIVPFVTSYYGLAAGVYGPVSGNWCWIRPEFLVERYAMTHGWRFAILFITFCIYIFVFFYIKRRLKPGSMMSTTTRSRTQTSPDGDELDLQEKAVLSGCSTPCDTPRMLPDHKAPASIGRDVRSSLAPSHHRRSISRISVNISGGHNIQSSYARFSYIHNRTSSSPGISHGDDRMSSYTTFTRDHKRSSSYNIISTGHTHLSTYNNAPHDHTRLSTHSNFAPNHHRLSSFANHPNETNRFSSSTNHPSGDNRCSTILSMSGRTTLSALSTNENHTSTYYSRYSLPPSSPTPSTSSTKTSTTTSTATTKPTHPPSLPANRPPTRTLSKPHTRVDREIWKMVLLNMYPITYFILWIPGIANRLAEAMGQPSRVLQIAQCSTQFIGFANASVYVYREHRKDVVRWVRSRR